MAAALAFRWDGARSRLYFQTRQGSYNEHSLIEFVRDLRRHFRGQQVILLFSNELHGMAGPNAGMGGLA
jgi:hypothetical protein